MRKLFVLKTFFLLKLLVLTLSASGADLSTVALNPDGSLLLMNFSEASAYCKTRGTRLPTVREFADYAYQHGARGTRETAYPNIATTEKNVYLEGLSNFHSGGYVALKKRSETNRFIVINFYYSNEGYIAPQVDDFQAWTSSPFPAYPGAQPYYVFSSKTGRLDQAAEDKSLLAVSCFG